MTPVLEEILVKGLCIVVTFQGPKRNVVDELWVVANGLVDM